MFLASGSAGIQIQRDSKPHHPPLPLRSTTPSQALAPQIACEKLVCVCLGRVAVAGTWHARERFSSVSLSTVSPTFCEKDAVLLITLPPAKSVMFSAAQKLIFLPEN